MRIEASSPSLGEAAPLLADTIRFGNFEVFKEQFVGVDRLAAHLLDFAGRDSFSVEVGIKERQPFGRFAHGFKRGGARQQQNLVGHLRG